MHELAVPGLPAERHLLVIGRTSATPADSAGPVDALH
jgi:hypothetical protein